jgi:hypothetical protein
MSNQTDHSRPGVSRGPTDLTPQLSQAPEFRVPTREAPQKVVTPHWTVPTPQTLTAQWERDEQVNQCRDCQRKFTFLVRRVCVDFHSFSGCPILTMAFLARKYFFNNLATGKGAQDYLSIVVNVDGFFATVARHSESYLIYLTLCMIQLVRSQWALPARNGSATRVTMKFLQMSPPG